jgi:hypothetical protein
MRHASERQEMHIEFTAEEREDPRHSKECRMTRI